MRVQFLRLPDNQVSFFLNCILVMSLPWWLTAIWVLYQSAASSFLVSIQLLFHQHIRAMKPLCVFIWEDVWILL